MPDPSEIDDSIAAGRPSGTVVADHEVFLVGEPEVVSYGELQDRIGQGLHGTTWPNVRVRKAVAKAAAWAKEKLPAHVRLRDHHPRRRGARSGRESFLKPWMIGLADARYPVTIERARARLGWTPAHRLRSSLVDMLDRLERDPVAWYEENDLPSAEMRSEAP